MRGRRGPAATSTTSAPLYEIDAGNLADVVCVDPQTTLELEQCPLRRTARLEIVIHRLLDRLMAVLPAQRRSLDEAQDLWLRCRQAECRLHAERWGEGSSAGPAAAICIEALTRERVRELRGFIREAEQGR